MELYPIEPITSLNSTVINGIIPVTRKVSSLVVGLSTTPVIMGIKFDEIAKDIMLSVKIVKLSN